MEVSETFTGLGPIEEPRSDLFDISAAIDVGNRFLFCFSYIMWQIYSRYNRCFAFILFVKNKVLDLNIKIYACYFTV